MSHISKFSDNLTNSIENLKFLFAANIQAYAEKLINSYLKLPIHRQFF